MSIINNDNRTFLITFSWKRTDRNFMVNHPMSMMEVIKQYDYKGIESIKEFHPAQGKFKRCSKKSILNWANWHTEASIYLTAHSYFS